MNAFRPRLEQLGERLPPTDIPLVPPPGFEFLSNPPPLGYYIQQTVGILTEQQTAIYATVEPWTAEELSGLQDISEPGGVIAGLYIDNTNYFPGGFQPSHIVSQIDILTVELGAFGVPTGNTVTHTITLFHEANPGQTLTLNQIAAEQQLALQAAGFTVVNTNGQGVVNGVMISLMNGNQMAIGITVQSLHVEDVNGSSVNDPHTVIPTAGTITVPSRQLH